MPALDIPDLDDALRCLLRQVPKGRVTTYGALARGLGDVVAARWVGHWMLHHDHTPGCRCHRVVRAGGLLGGYVSGHAGEKARRLSSEGVRVVGGTIDLDRWGFETFEADQPLQRLERLQRSLRSRVLLRGPRRMPKLVGGVDVSYVSPTEAVAAYALVEVSGGHLHWHHNLRRTVKFPYISSYLSFRELPILLELLRRVEAAGRMAEVLLVDGSGVLHPRGAGIASHLGVVAGVATIGVTKTLLCGTIDGAPIHGNTAAPQAQSGETLPRIMHHGRPRGVVMQAKGRSSKRIFVSPGHRIGLPMAQRIARALLCGHKLPEPIYWADRLSRAAARKYKAEQTPVKSAVAGDGLPALRLMKYSG